MNPEKEETWLNSMSDKGLACVRYFFIFYFFEQSDPGKYRYKFALMDAMYSDPKSQEFTQFVEESGAECIGCWLRWAMFRKASEDSDFILFSDNESQMAHYNRILTMWLCICPLIIFSTIMCFRIYSQFRSALMLTLGAIWSLIGFAFMINIIQFSMKVRILKRNRYLGE